MLCRAPRATTIMNGKPSQVLVVRLAQKARAKLPNQSMCTVPPTRAPSSAFTAPYCTWNSPLKIRAVM